MKYYAGLEPSGTPLREIARMEKIGKLLGELGYTLRSGGGEGAGQAFERGAQTAGSSVEVWSPNTSYFPLPEWATEKASSICWESPLERMEAHMISSTTRNMFVVFGDDEEVLKPVDFVVYWSASDPMVRGGGCEETRYAIRASHEAEIPTYNLRTQSKDFAEFLTALKGF